MPSLARCCDTVAAGLPTRSARVLTDSSPAASARTILNRVASASIENTSTANSTRSSPAPAGMPSTRPVCVSARIRRLSLARVSGATHPSEDPLSWVVGWSAESAGVEFGRRREAAARYPVGWWLAHCEQASQLASREIDAQHRPHAVCDHAEASTAVYACPMLKWPG